MLDELLILKKIKEGDIKAFEELFRRYYFPLCCYAAGITGQMAPPSPFFMKESRFAIRK